MKKILILFITLFFITGCSFNSLKNNGSVSLSGSALSQMIMQSRRAVVSNENYSISIEVKGDFSYKNTVTVSGQTILSRNISPITINDIPIGSKIQIILQIFSAKDELMLAGSSEQIVIKAGENEVTVSMTFLYYENEIIKLESVNDGIQITPTPNYEGDISYYKIKIKNIDDDLELFSAQVDCNPEEPTFLYKYVKPNTKYQIQYEIYHDGQRKGVYSGGIVYSKGGSGERSASLKGVPILDTENNNIYVDFNKIGDFDITTYGFNYTVSQSHREMYDISIYNDESGEVSKNAKITGALIDFEMALSYCDQFLPIYVDVYANVFFEDENDVTYSMDILSWENSKGRILIPTDTNNIVTETYEFAMANGIATLTIKSVSEFSDVINILDSDGLKNKLTSCSTAILDLSALNSIETLSCAGESGSEYSVFTPFTVVVVPSGVKTIGEYAFKDCERLVLIGIDINNSQIGSLQEVKQYAFSGCRNLTTFYAPNVNSIGLNAFKDCTSLHTVSFTGNATVQSNSFDGCSGITSVNFMLTDSSGYDIFVPFVKASSIVTITPISGITDSNFKEIMGSSKMGQAVTNFSKIVGSNSLVYTLNLVACTNLKKITSDENNNPSSILKQYSVIILPNSVEEIGNSAFYQANKLASINIPASTTKIGTYAFNGCSSLMSATFEDSESSWSIATNPSQSFTPSDSTETATALKDNDKSKVAWTKITS